MIRVREFKAHELDPWKPRDIRLLYKWWSRVQEKLDRAVYDLIGALKRQWDAHLERLLANLGVTRRTVSQVIFHRTWYRLCHGHRLGQMSYTHQATWGRVWDHLVAMKDLMGVVEEVSAMGLRMPSFQTVLEDVRIAHKGGRRFLWVQHPRENRDATLGFRVEARIENDESLISDPPYGVFMILLDISDVVPSWERNLRAWEETFWYEAAKELKVIPEKHILDPIHWPSGLAWICLDGWHPCWGEAHDQVVACLKQGRLGLLQAIVETWLGTPSTSGYLAWNEWYSSILGEPITRTCDVCGYECPEGELIVCRECRAHACPGCVVDDVCVNCCWVCDGCEERYPIYQDYYMCPECERIYCEDCWDAMTGSYCRSCQHEGCDQCDMGLEQCELCGKMQCNHCKTELWPQCPACGKTICGECTEALIKEGEKKGVPLVTDKNTFCSIVCYRALNPYEDEKKVEKDQSQEEKEVQNAV